MRQVRTQEVTLYMPDMEKMSLKTFWDEMEQRLAPYSAEALRAILRAMARETPPAERRTFLDKLKPEGEIVATTETAIEPEDLLSDIDDLTQELQADMEQAEEWEERHGWGDDYDEEDSLGPYEELVGPLTMLFDRVEAVFDDGDLPLARAAYKKLFEALQLEDDYGRGIRAHDLASVDLGEACARYLRAVYETESPAHRPKALFEQMHQIKSWFSRPRPMLEDLLQISPKPMPDRDRFFSDWKAFLREQNDRAADAWLREAIRLSQGTQGLEELARAEGKDRPRAYLDWFAALEQASQHRETLAAAQEALRTLAPQLPIRAAIADYLCAAASRLNETEALLAGRWEAFVAKPVLPRLLDVWEAAPTEQERTRRMQQAAQHVADYLAHPPRPEGMEAWGHEDDLERPALIDRSVLAHAHLLAEDWNSAHQLAAQEKVLGWSYSSNAQGLVVAFFLVLLSGKTPGPQPRNLTELWQWGLQNTIRFGFWSDKDREENSPFQRLERIYAEHLSKVSLSRDQQERLLSWCLDVAKQRASAIVSNQNRNSYGKAAVLVAVCAEALKRRGNDKEARSLLDDIRNRFPRHRAFLAELNAAVGKR